MTAEGEYDYYEHNPVEDVDGNKRSYESKIEWPLVWSTAVRIRCISANSNIPYHSTFDYVCNLYSVHENEGYALYALWLQVRGVVDCFKGFLF